MENYRDFTPEHASPEEVRVSQEEVNASLEELQPEIDRINLVVEQLWSSDSQQALQYIRDAVTYLDDKWQFMGHYFLVTGSWNGPKVAFDSETRNFSFVAAHHEAFDVVESQGFLGYQTFDQPPRVGMLFYSDVEEIHTSVLAGGLIKKYTAEPSQVTLQYLHSSSHEQQGSSLEAITTGLHETDRVLKFHLGDKTSDFYTKTADEQYMEISSVVDKVNDLMPSPSSGQMLLTDTSASMVYVQHQRGERLAPVSLKRREIELAGKVEGVTTYDMVVNAGGDMQFLEPGQCETARSGLMLVMSEYVSNLNLDDEGEPGVVLVPLGRTSKLELSIEEE